MAVYPYSAGVAGISGRQQGASWDTIQSNLYPQQSSVPMPTPKPAPAPAPAPAPPPPPPPAPTPQPPPAPSAAPPPAPAPAPAPAAPSPAIQSLMAAPAPAAPAEGFADYLNSSVTRPGLGQRQLPQSQPVLTGGRVY